MNQKHLSQDLNPTRFATHRMRVRDGVEIAYCREGVGGVPLLMLHGWPGGKRLFWRNIEELANAGFEVIVPDQRGFGESPIVPGSPLRVQESALDMHALMLALGHESCVVVGGDQGAAVAIQLIQRFPGFVKRFVTYNGLAPILPELYARHGVPTSQFEEINKVSDHLELHGLKADSLAQSLGDDAVRIDYVKCFFQGKVWREGDPIRHLAAKGSFSNEQALFQAEQICRADSFRASLGIYEGFMKPEEVTEPFLIDRTIDVDTLVFWGMRDEIVGLEYPQQMQLGCTQLTGPFYLDAGHFVQWEAAPIFNKAIIAFNRDLLAGLKS